MPSSHVYADLSAGFFRYRSSDGTHSHIHRVHVGFATIDNVTDPGSPTNPDNLISPEADVNCTARNFLALMRQVMSSAYTLTVLDFQGVSCGAPSGPPIPLQPYSLAGALTDGGVPEAQNTMTFRDSEGAPCSVRWFGSQSNWTPQTKDVLVADWAGTPAEKFAAYLVGIARTGGVSYPAGLSHVFSHHGQAFAVPLALVSGLNNRLRREYRVK